jgi:hypothetical protein
MLQLLEPPTAAAKRVSFDSEVCLPVIVEYRREQEGFFEVTHVRFTDPLPCIQGRLAWMNLPGAVMRAARRRSAGGGEPWRLRG